MESKTLDIYLFFVKDYSVFGIFREEKCIYKFKILNNQLGENLVETFKESLVSQGLNLSQIKAFYYSVACITLNSLRLVSLFVKTMSVFLDVKLYIRQLSVIEENIESILNNFCRVKKVFRLVDNPVEFQPPYTSDVRYEQL